MCTLNRTSQKKKEAGLLKSCQGTKPPEHEVTLAPKALFQGVHPALTQQGCCLHSTYLRNRTSCEHSQLTPRPQRHPYLSKQLRNTSTSSLITHLSGERAGWQQHCHPTALEASHLARQTPKSGISGKPAATFPLHKQENR